MEKANQSLDTEVNYIPLCLPDLLLTGRGDFVCCGVVLFLSVLSCIS